MRKVGESHELAMNLAEQAETARRRGDSQRAEALFREALEKEREAASEVSDKLDLEPTRSVLYRSAAYLAVECRDFIEAERLAAMGLAGRPPADMRDELRELWEEITFRSHLKLRGLVLDNRQFQVSLVGDAISGGVAESDVFLRFAESVERLVSRTAERKVGRDFREAGRRRREIADQVEMFVSAPRVGSFAVSFSIGYPEQMALPGMSLAEKVIDELFDCLELFNLRRTEALKERIPDPAYLSNFVNLARSLAPDGQAVRRVGFTAMRDGKERSVELTTLRAELPSSEVVHPKEEVKSRVTVVGILKWASRLQEKDPTIKIVTSEGSHHSIRVPPELMDDIVRPLWDFRVRVKGRREGAKVLLEEIDQLPEDE